MAENALSPDDAARALAEVAERRRQVAATALLYPWWYFPVMGAWVATFISWMYFIDSPWYMPGGVAITFAYGGIAVVAHLRRRVKPHWSLYGTGGVLVLVAFFLAAAVVATLATAFVDEQRGSAVVGGLAAGASFALMGTVLQFVMRWIIRRRASRVGR